MEREIRPEFEHGGLLRAIVNAVGFTFLGGVVVYIIISTINSR